MQRFVKRLVLVATMLLGLVACGNAPANTSSGQATGGQPAAAGGSSGATQRNLRFVVVSHGQASDPFWSVVKNGVDQAAKDMGVKVEYQAPDKFDMVAMSQLIDAAVASKPDGLVGSIPGSNAVGPSI